jgi:hypothetical protein
MEIRMDNSSNSMIAPNGLNPMPGPTSRCILVQNPSYNFLREWGTSCQSIFITEACSTKLTRTCDTAVLGRSKRDRHNSSACASRENDLTIFGGFRSECQVPQQALNFERHRNSGRINSASGRLTICSLQSPQRGNTEAVFEPGQN